MWKNFRGCGSDRGRASEGVVRATDGVITATEKVMSDTKSPSEDFKMAGLGLGVRRLW